MSDESVPESDKGKPVPRHKQAKTLSKNRKYTSETSTSETSEKDPEDS